MSDDRPRAPTYGPPITMPSVDFLGRIAYYTWSEADLSRPAVDSMELSEAERQTWFEADLSRPAVDWMELREAERDTWRRVAQKIAEQIRVATERSHALGNYLPPPRCRAKWHDRYTQYICCRWDPHPAETGADDEGHRWVPVEP